MSRCCVGALVLCLMACGPKYEAEFDEFGLHVDNVSFLGAKSHVQEDGDYDVLGDEEIYIDGLGHHRVTIEEEDQPVAMGGLERLHITDDAMGQLEHYTFDPAKSALTFSNAEASVTVVVNPDKTYSVDGMAFPTGKAAYAAVKTSVAFRGVSPFSVMAAFVLAHYAAPTRAQQACISKAAGCEEVPPAQLPPPGAPCNIAGDLCNCAACDQAGKSGCRSCP